MEIESLSYRTLKNAVYSFLNYAWPIVFSIFITPIIVHRLGTTEYGIYVFLFTLTGFLNLIDFGLTLSMVKHISEYVALKKYDDLNRLIATAQTVYVIIGVLGLIIFFVIGKFLLPVFHIPTGGSSMIWVVFTLVGLAFFVSAIHLTYSVIPYALQRYDIVTKASLLQLTFFSLSSMVAVLLGFKLKVVFLLYVISMACWALFFRLAVKKNWPEITITFGWDRRQLASIYRYGILAAIINSSFNALLQIDKFLIPIFIGPASLAYYSLPGGVAQKVAGVTGSLGTVFFPLTSSIVSEGNTAKLTEIYKKAFRNFTLIAAAFSSAIAFFGYKILLFWLGKDFADQGVVVLLILTATYFLFSLYSPLYNFLMGLGKMRFLTISSVSLAVINVVLIVILVPRYGIVGAAWAFFGSVLGVPLLFYWTEQKILHLSGMASFYVKLYAKILVTTVAYYILVLFILRPLAVSLLALVIIGPVSVLLYFALYKVLGFYELEDWELFVSFAKKIPQRLGLKKQ